MVISEAGSVAEATGNYLTYNVSLSNPVAANTTVTLSLSGDAGNTDRGPLEYHNGTTWVAVPANNQITLPATGGAVQVRVAILDDAATENAETVILNAGNSSNPLVSTGDTGTGTIRPSARPESASSARRSVPPPIQPPIQPPAPPPARFWRHPSGGGTGRCRRIGSG